MQDALNQCKDEGKVFIIGGADIFSESLPFIDSIIVTALERDVDGDVYFPDIDSTIFQQTESTHYNIEEPYSIIRYERIK